MKRYFLKNGKVFSLVYDEGTETTTTTVEDPSLNTDQNNDQNNDQNQNVDQNQNNQNQNNQNQNGKVNFTREQQEFINKKMAEERRKLQVQNEKTIKELEKLKQAQGITQKQRDDLQTRIDELQAQFMSKEELLRKEKEKLAKEHKTIVEQLSFDRDSWKNRYHTSTINRALQDSAIRHEAFNPEQIMAILEKQTRLVEESDEEGKPTGSLVPRVKLNDVDGEGKPITLDLTVDQAVKRMKDTPDKFGNLFKSGVAGGIGGTGSANNGRGKTVDPSKMSMHEYLEWRKKNPNLDVRKV
jgi:hypothetical protein